MICVGLSDHTECIFKKTGFDIDAVRKHVEDNRVLKGYVEEDCENVSPKIFFSIECDVIIPAAKELVICGHDAHNINCKLVVEAANGPIDMEAEEIILNKNIDIIPDILANSGGVTVSYFEWLQNKRCESWEEEETLNMLSKRMKKNYLRVKENE